MSSSQSVGGPNTRVSLANPTVNQNITLSGQLNLHEVNSRSVFGKMLTNLFIIMKISFANILKRNNEAEIENLNNKKVHTIVYQGNTIRVTTKEMLKALHLKVVGPGTREEIAQTNIIAQINQGDTTAIEQSIQNQLNRLQAEEDRRIAVREAVMQEISQDSLSSMIPMIENLGTVDLSMIDNNLERRNAYVAALSSGSVTAQSTNEGELATHNMANADIMVREWVSNNSRLTPDLVSQLNACLTAGTLNNGSIPGDYRKAGVRVQTGQGEYLAGSHVRSEMFELCDWVNTEFEKAGGDKLKIIEIAARTMSWAVSIHPFLDGNGRTCRMLVNYILMKGGIPSAIIDSERGHAARFGDGLAYLRNNPTLSEARREEILNNSGPTPETVMRNIITCIEATVNQFGNNGDVV